MHNQYGSDRFETDDYGIWRNETRPGAGGYLIGLLASAASGAIVGAIIGVQYARWFL